MAENIIKFQHEIFNGTFDDSGNPNVDVLYPKTSSDMIVGLTAAIQALLTDTKVKAVTVVAGTSTTAPKIKITLSDGTEITSGALTVATKTAYGVIKLSSATDSSSEAEAATLAAVKTAKDAADAAQSTATNAQTAAASAKSSIDQLLTTLNNQILRVGIITGVSISAGTSTKVSMSSLGVTSANFVDVSAFTTNDKTYVLVNEGITFSVLGSDLYIKSNVKAVVELRIIYNLGFSISKTETLTQSANS